MSRNFSGSTGTRGSGCSSYLPSSNRCGRRFTGRMRMWWPQWVQTSWLASQSRMNSICSHLRHFSQRFSGADLRETRARSLGRTKLVSQFIGRGMARLTGPAKVAPQSPKSSPRSAPETAERRDEICRLLDLAEQLALLIVGAKLLGGAGFEIGDDGRLVRHLVRGDRQNVFLAQSGDAKLDEVGL